MVVVVVVLSNSSNIVVVAMVIRELEGVQLASDAASFCFSCNSN